MRVVAHTLLSDGVLDALGDLDARVFSEPYPRQRLAHRAGVAHNLLVLFAEVEGQVVGYKVGYEMTDWLYYSWIGGVDPAFRRRGIASALMEAQHAQAAAWGYRRVRTHTENRFRDMLILNLKHGFDVVGLTHRGERLVLQLEKPLAP